MEKKIDRRILKTKRAIRNAYAELLKTKNSNEITIKEIAEVADISRKTFYYYYEGVWEIEDEIENELTELVKHELENLDFKSIIQSPYIIFERLNKIVSTDLDFCGNLLANGTNSTLIIKICKIFEVEMKKLLAESKNFEESEIDLISKYCISGMLIVYQNWFNSDRSLPLEQISKDLSKIMFDGLNGFLKQK